MSDFYTDPDPQNDPASIEREIVEGFEERFEDWFAPAGSLADRQIKMQAFLHSVTRGLGATARAAMFKGFGEKIASIPPITAAPASVTATVTLTDDDGHTIEAGTKVTIAGPNDKAYGFEVVEDVEVPKGESSTAAGEVILRAVAAGTSYNGLSADPVASSGVAFIESFALEGVTAGGVDAEDEDAYLDRLVLDFRNLSLSLIVEEDFARDALNIAGIAACLCIGGYDPTGPTEDVPLVVCDFTKDASGANVSAERKAELQARQQANVPSGVLVFVHDPTRTKVDVKATVAPLPGFDPAVVVTAVEARLAEYLSPAKWGSQGQQGEAPGGGWSNATHVYFYELVSEVDRVPGVDRVVSLECRKAAGAYGKSDLELSGPAPLAEPGELKVSAA